MDKVSISLVLALSTTIIPSMGLALCELGAPAWPPNSIDENIPARALLYEKHQCNSAFIELVRQEYNFKKQHWGDWGWDSCSADDDQAHFPRIIDAVYLLRNGIVQPPFGGFHRSGDYADLPDGSEYHHRPKDADNASMTSYGGIAYTDRVEIKCPAFRSAPSKIASNLLHEAEHFILGTWKGTKKHDTKILPGGASNDADEWVLHNTNDPPELLYQITTRHPMYQIEVEFLCDLAHHAAGWVTYDLRAGAAEMANRKIISNILYPPGWMCGKPRPAPTHWPRDIRLVEDAVAKAW